MHVSFEKLVKTLIAHHLGWRSDQVELAQSLRRDLGFDNLSLVGIALEVEEQRGADFPFERLEHTDTVADLVELTSSLVPRAPKSPGRQRVLRRQLGTLRRLTY